MSEVLGEVHDVFHVFRAELEGGTPLVDGRDEDVQEVDWVLVDEASARMPSYDDGVQVLLESDGAGHDAARE